KPNAHRLTNASARLFEGVLVAAARGLGAELPIATGDDPLAVVGEPAPRRHREDALVDGVGLGDDAEREVVVDARVADDELLSRSLDEDGERLELRREGDPAAGEHGVVERLFAEAVAKE